MGGKLTMTNSGQLKIGFMAALCTQSRERAIIHLVVWGPSAKLLAEDQAIQAEVKAIQEVGVVTEACVVCARRYGVDNDLKEFDSRSKAWVNRSAIA